MCVSSNRASERISSPSSPSGRSVLRRAGETSRRRCVDASGYSQRPSLIGVIHVPVEWLKPIQSQGEGDRERVRGERGESGDEIRTQESLEMKEL